MRGQFYPYRSEAEIVHRSSATGQPHWLRPGFEPSGRLERLADASHRVPTTTSLNVVIQPLINFFASACRDENRGTRG